MTWRTAILWALAALLMAPQCSECITPEEARAAAEQACISQGGTLRTFIVFTDSAGCVASTSYNCEGTDGPIDLLSGLLDQ